MAHPEAPESNGSHRTNGHNGHGHEAAPTKENPAPPGTWRFGMVLFLGSLAILFLASIVATWVIRARTGQWPPPGMPPPPSGLWVSTAILLISSATLEWGLRLIRRNQLQEFRVALLTTTILGLAFIVSQVTNWFLWVGSSATIRSSLYAYLFYVLTGLHAAHVLGGLVPLVVVTVNAWYSRYSALHHEGVKQVAVYWHFLGVVWGVLLLVIFSTTF